MINKAKLRSTLIGLLAAAGLVVTGACSDGEPTAGAEAPAAKGAVAPDQPAAGHEGEDHDEGIVELTPAKVQASEIETTAASFTSLPTLLVTTGQVDFNEDRLAHVSPRIPGRVHEVKARLGAQVRRGQVLAMLDSIELGRSKAEYLQAKAREELTRDNYEREQKLYGDRVSSQREMLAAKAAHIETEAELRSAEETLHLYGLTDAEVGAVTYENPGRSLFAIRAPLSGKVVEKHITVGELVRPERNLFSLADLSEVWVWIDVYERDLRQVHIDDLVDVRVDAFPSLVFRGAVSYLSARVDLDTRRVRARIDVKNPDEKLRPGMFAQVELSDPHGANATDINLPALTVPEAAVQRDGDSMIVFIDLGEGRFERRVVEVGRKTKGLIEVTEGLSGGEVVVSAGVFFLKSELAKGELGESHGH